MIPPLKNPEKQKKGYATRLKKKTPLKSAVSDKTANPPSSASWIKHLQLLCDFRAGMDAYSLYYAIGLTLVALFFLGFGLERLGKFITTDETVWLHVRIPQYWQALLSGDFAKTTISRNPGITHSLLAGITEFFIHLENYNPLTIETYLFWWRMPGLAFNGLSLFVIYHFLRKLTDKDHALLITGLIAFTPVILGMSKIPNSDSQLWNTGFIAILTFLLYLKTDLRRYVIYCGISFGLCLLCKFVATSLYLFFFTYLYAGYLFNQYDNKAFQRKSIGFFQILLLSWTIYAFLYPATLLRPQMIFSTTIGHFEDKVWYILFLMFLIYIESGLFKGRLSNWLRNRIDFSRMINVVIGLPLLALGAFLSYHRFFTDELLYYLTIRGPLGQYEFLPSFLQSIDWMLTGISIPVIVSIMTFAGMAAFAFGQKKFKEHYHLMTLMMVSLVIYMVGASLQGTPAKGRYAIIMLPVMAFIAGTFYLRLLPYKKFVIPTLLAIAFVDIFLFSPLSYMDYSNDKYFKERGRYYSWGMGGYEIAQLANQLPEAEKLTVLSDYHGFAHFFVGRNRYMKERPTHAHIRQFDYLCLSSKGKTQKESWMMMTYPLQEYYNMPLEDSVFYVGSLERGYVKLVKVDKKKEYLTIPGTFDPEYFLDLSGSFSIGFWFRTNVAQPENPIYIGKDDQKGILMHFIDIDGILCFEAKYSETDRLNTPILNNNQWQHILLRHRGGNVQDQIDLFIDGTRCDTMHLSKDKSGAEKFFINTRFQGQMQDFRIYDFALSQSQINAIFNAGEIQMESILFDGEKNFRPVSYFTVE
jgi:hypothetical protein